MDIILLETGDVLLQEDGLFGFGLESGRGQEATFFQGSIAAVALTLALTGAAVTVDQGSVTASLDTGGDVTVALTGSAITSAQQSITFTTSMGATGQAITSADGTVTLTITPSQVVGQSSTIGHGAVSAVGNDVTVNISGVEADFSIGTLEQAISAVGSAINSAAGTLSPSYTRTLVGEQSTIGQGVIVSGQEADDTLMTGSQGTVVSSASVALVGSASTTAAGTLTVTGDLTLALTGEASTADLGDISPDPFFDISGLEIVSAQQNIGAPGGATLSGTAITVSQGNIFTTTDREFALTGSSVSVLGGITFASSLAFPAGALITATAQVFGPRGTSLTGMQIGAEAGFLEGPRRDKDAGKPSTKRSRTVKNKTVVEIDGQEFIVDSEDEAAQLVEALRTAAAEKAVADANEVIQKRKTASRRAHKPLRLDPVELTAPTVNSADTTYAAELQTELDAIYAKAAADAELALRLHHAQVLDEEEAIVLLLASL